MTNLKKDLQIERIIFFSDAVFAIAITLLALEIRIPEFEVRTERNAVIALVNLIPRFIGFFISFFIIGVYWVSHHKLFSYVITYDRKLLWKNLYFLLFLVLLPFTTGFYSEYFNLKTPLLVYSINIFLLGLMQIGLLNHISDKTKGLSKGLENKFFVSYIRWRSIVVGSTFIFITATQYFLPESLLSYTRFLFLLIFLWIVILNKVYIKKGVDVKNY